MPRVHTKKKNSAGKPYPCGQCLEPIKPGEQYHEWTFRYGGPHRQHASHGYPKPSQLTQSKMGGVYSAIETAEATIAGADDVADIAQALNDAADEVEQVKDEYQDGIDNLPEQFQDSSPSQEKVENLDGFVSALQDAASDIENEEFDEESEEHIAPCPKVDADAEGECTCLEERKSDWLEEQRQKATDALGEFSE